MNFRALFVHHSKIPASMSPLGQKRTFTHLPPMSARFTPKSGHWLSVSGCPLCAKSGHSAVQQSIATIGAGTDEFLPAGSAGCTAPSRSHHILLLALYVLPHPAHVR
jgi:hypothetical protein